MNSREYVEAKKQSLREEIDDLSMRVCGGGYAPDVSHLEKELALLEAVKDDLDADNVNIGKRCLMWLRQRLYSVLSCAAIPLLVVGAFGGNLPDGYFQLLRVGVTVAAALGALYAKRDGFAWWAILYGACAIVFNPVAPLSFVRDVWIALDVGAAAFFLAAGLKLRKPDASRWKPWQYARFLAVATVICLLWGAFIILADGAHVFARREPTIAPMPFVPISRTSTRGNTRGNTRTNTRTAPGRR